VQRALLTNPAIHAVLAFIHASGTSGVTEADVANFLTTIARVNHTTAQRREATIRAWLVGADLVASQNDRLVATIAPERVLIRDADNSVIGKPMALLKPLVTPRTAKVPSPPGVSIGYVIDAATHERARREHQRLVEAMAATITAFGAVPEANKYVDLAATIDSKHYLFEMKSTTSESLHAQVRRAIAQLYEYRYLQELPTGVLCLVLDRRPEGRNGWLVAYLEEDRGIAVCWLEASGKFACSAVSGQQLPFLQ